MKFIDHFLFRIKIRSVVKKGGDLNSVTFKGEFFIHYAVMQRLRNELKFLIEHKADLNRPAEHRAFSPLHFASFGSDDVSEIAGMLIDAGADIKSRSSQGETALHLAASLNGNRHLLKKLIASGAEINSTDYENETPLHKAAYWGNHFAARHLMLHGADLNFKNVDGMTPLHLTVFFCQTHLMRLLLESGSDKNIKNNNKEIPLDIAENYILPDENARGIMISLLSEEKNPPCGEIITSVENVSKIRTYSRFINDMPGSAGPYILRGEIYMEAGDFESAMNDFKRAIELEPENSKSYLYRGMLYAAAGDIKSAMAECEVACELGDEEAEGCLEKLKELC